jgi:hypothetical protein
VSDEELVRSLDDQGLETLLPNSDAPSAGLVAGQPVKRRFTNIWRKEDGTWRLFARHANVVTPR